MTDAHEETVPLTVRAARAFAAYVAGDGSLMSQLVDDLTPILWHLARGQGLSPAAAEDVVQQSWLRLVESADRIHDPQSVVKWLMTTTRREAWRVARAGRVVESQADPSQAADALTEPATQTVPAEVIGAEERTVLWRHVDALSEKCRYLLRVIAFADRPDYAAIAASLGMPVGSIGPTRGRCLAALRTALVLDPAYETGELS
jgi:RNA polymerase sigma factor (sigma-70 family)